MYDEHTELHTKQNKLIFLHIESTIFNIINYYFLPEVMGLNFFKFFWHLDVFSDQLFWVISIEPIF